MVHAYEDRRRGDAGQTADGRRGSTEKEKEKDATSVDPDPRSGGVPRSGGSATRGVGGNVRDAMTVTNPDRLDRALADVGIGPLDVEGWTQGDRDKIAVAFETAHRRKQDRKAWVRHELVRRIREARKDAGLTQDELADRAHTTSKNISRWETGERTPDDDHRWHLAAALNVEVTHLHPELETQP